jgi:hypothetical protein
MTKAQYFEMCELLGSEIKESEIPVEFDDLLVEVQEAMQIYGNLQDCWDYMGGNYIGKNFNYIETVFKFYNIEPDQYKQYYDLLMTIDRIRTKQIQDSKPKDTKAR